MPVDGDDVSRRLVGVSPAIPSGDNQVSDVRQLAVLPGSSWVGGEHSLAQTSPTKAVLPFICVTHRPPETGERPMAGSDEGRENAGFFQDPHQTHPRSIQVPFLSSRQ